MISSEEVGRIISRIALADEGFLTLVLIAAQKSGGALLPEDCAKLSEWGTVMRMLRTSIKAGENNTPH